MDATKCAQMNCYKPRAPKQKYCSREHAPYGNYDGNFTYEKKMEKSTTKGPGVTSRRVSIYDPKENPKVEIQRFGQRQMKKNTSGTEKITINDVKVNEDSGTLLLQNKNECEELSLTPKSTVTPKLDGPDNEKIMQEIEKNTYEKNLPEGRSVTPSMVSSPQSMDLEKEKSASMTLIDESATHLRDLMKSVSLKGADGSTNAGGISVACNCASQIHKLIRLKFDIARTYGR